MDTYREFRIGELAEAAGVTRRTIHYYVGRGLLPAPSGAGLGTTYGDEHYWRLLLIKKLQEEYLPLEQIRQRLASMSLGEVRSALDGEVYYAATAPQVEPAAEFGSAYRRVGLGAGVELHFPEELPGKGQMLVAELIALAEKIMKEA